MQVPPESCFDRAPPGHRLSGGGLADGGGQSAVQKRRDRKVDDAAHTQRDERRRERVQVRRLARAGLPDQIAEEREEAIAGEGRQRHGEHHRYARKEEEVAAGREGMFHHRRLSKVRLLAVTLFMTSSWLKVRP